MKPWGKRALFRCFSAAKPLPIASKSRAAASKLFFSKTALERRCEFVSRRKRFVSRDTPYLLGREIVLVLVLVRMLLNGGRGDGDIDKDGEDLWFFLGDMVLRARACSLSMYVSLSDSVLCVS